MPIKPFNSSRIENRFIISHELNLWYANRRRESIIPEIRVVAPSFDRGLDESSPHITHQSPKLTHISDIYQSYEDVDSRTDCSRYKLAQSTEL